MSTAGLLAEPAGIDLLYGHIHSKMGTRILNALVNDQYKVQPKMSLHVFWTTPCFIQFELRWRFIPEGRPPARVPSTQDGEPIAVSVGRAEAVEAHCQDYSAPPVKSKRLKKQID